MLDFISSISLPVIISSLPREKVCTPDIRVGYRRRGSIFIRDWRGMGGRSRLLRKNRFSYIHGGRGEPSHSPVDKNTDRIAVKSQCHGTGSGHRYTRREEGRGRLTGDEGERRRGTMTRRRDESVYPLFSMYVRCVFEALNRHFLLFGTKERMGGKKETRGIETPVPDILCPPECSRAIASAT